MKGVDIVRTWTNPVRFLLLGLVVLFLEAHLARFACAQDSIFEKKAELDSDFKNALEKLAKICDEQELPEQAKQTRSWFIKRDPKRLYVFLPTKNDPLKPKADAPKLIQNWNRAFSKARSEHAERLFQLALSTADENPEIAYLWFHEVLRENPDHKKARGIAGFYENQKYSITKGIPKNPALPRKLTDRIVSKNFMIWSTGDREKTRLLAEKLELWNYVWRQANFSYWSDDKWLARRIKGDRRARIRNLKHKVVLFKDKEQYKTLLSPHVPGIGESLGYYDDQRRESFFYDGDEKVQITWLHEMTHQLFQESVSGTEQAGVNQGIWAIEGVAIYFESMLEHPGYVTLGGFDSRRLQFAKLRRFRSGFRPSFTSIAKLSRRDFQQNEHVDFLYTHSAALAHLLFDHVNVKQKRAFLNHVQNLYKGQKTDLLESIGQTEAEIEKQLAQSLVTRQMDVSNFLMRDNIEELVCFPGDVTDQGVKQICKKLKLRLLDLSTNKVTDASMASLSKMQSLDALFLAKTAIGDEGVKHISSLVNLVELDLSQTKITNAAIADLAKLPKLQVLWLSNNQLTDQAADALTKIKNLKSLDISNTKMTHLAVEQLKAKFPKITIKQK